MQNREKSASLEELEEATPTSSGSSTICENGRDSVGENDGKSEQEEAITGQSQPQTSLPPSLYPPPANLDSDFDNEHVDFYRKHSLLLKNALEKLQMVRGRSAGTNVTNGRHRGSQSTSQASSQSVNTSDGFDQDPINYEEALDQLAPEDKDFGDRLRRHLQFFFMDPLEKWKVRRQFPFKLALQILKILLITAQLILFAELRMSHVDFMEDTTTVMRHKFLKDWNDDRDAVSYPPNEGRYAVYDGKGIFQHMAFIIESYYSIESESFASFSYDTRHFGIGHWFSKNASLNAGVKFDEIPPLELCYDRIASVTVNNNTYEFDINNVYECSYLNLTKQEVDSIKEDSMKVEEAFNKRSMTFKPEDALRISKVFIRFSLRTIHFAPVTADQTPECYRINVSVIFDNSRHTGQVHVNIQAEINYERECNGRILKGNFLPYDTILMAIIDVLVLFMCLASLVLCIRALIKAHLLKNKTVDFFENILRQPVALGDKLEFVNLWYVMILVNDVFIIIGTVCKVTIEFRDFDNDVFTLTGILLGVGALLVYVGVLRYFKFFNKYNILMLTLKKSLPNILRFLTCAAVLYMGFLIAGWVIIGPYSMKFRTLSSCSEALFSLVNGDDMFATFYTIKDSNTTIKIFGTVYIYLFVSLFIYVILSLFIAIIMDAYEVVKDRYAEENAFERSALRDFMATAPAVSLAAPNAQAQFAPSNLLNLVAGNDSNSVRALEVIDRVRDRIRDGLGNRFESFTNPLHDQHEHQNVNAEIQMNNGISSPSPYNHNDSHPVNL
ncbi:unnamed protein product, partial [Mesorhabditis belari]|uniref:Uncharacterized protein n=1 Tax=Mesorhabditis belari TaxID=2138241 RepID=A0AAF3F5C4_9BILA